MNASIDADYLAPDRYDRYYGAYAEVPGWLLNVLSSKGQVLELACGTGRFAIPLAEHGLAVTGLDYSEPMLRLARSKAESRQTRADWILADMRRSRYAMYARHIGNKCDCRVFRIICENPSLLSTTHN